MHLILSQSTLKGIYIFKQNIKELNFDKFRFYSLNLSNIRYFNNFSFFEGHFLSSIKIYIFKKKSYSIKVNKSVFIRSNNISCYQCLRSGTFFHRLSFPGSLFYILFRLRLPVNRLISLLCLLIPGSWLPVTGSRF